MKFEHKRERIELLRALLDEIVAADERDAERSAKIEAELSPLQEALAHAQQECIAHQGTPREAEALRKANRAQETVLETLKIYVAHLEQMRARQVKQDQQVLALKRSLGLPPGTVLQ